jgi:S1/P1 Nuclease
MSPIPKMKSAPQFAILVTICAGAWFGTTAQAYGPLGHEIVGAIADERLANTPTAPRVRALLDGLTLEKVAPIPDEIKGWDQNGADDPRSFRYAAHRRIDEQLRDFWRANPPIRDKNPGAPSHHWFHYADVPVVPAQKYRDGKVGRRRWDIVHMIPYCVQVLKGRISEQNDRKITRPIAVILLAHLVADIHQPLHVGAE